MSENEYMDFTPPIPATEGWSQMQVLLDEHMPVTPKKKPLIYYWFAAALLALLLSGFPLRETMVNKPELHLNNVPVPAATDIITTTENSSATSAVTTVYNKPAASNTINSTSLFMNSGKNTETNQPGGNEVPYAGANNIIDSATALVASQDVIEKHTPVDTVLPKAKSKTIRSSKWQLFAGVSTNIVTSEKTKNFQPYPSAELRFAPNKHFFIATGLSILSPVTTSTSAVEKSYYVNDTANNVKLYNENVVYTRMHYVDVPLTFGVNLTKHLSVSAGLQASVLLFSESYDNVESYDFQMNRLDVLAAATFAPPNAGKPDEAFTIDTRKVEFRYVAGVEYQLNRFSLGIRYQHAVAPAIKGEVTSGKNNSLLSVGLKYQIR